MAKNKIVTHLKGDIANFKKEANEDKKLIKEIEKKKHKKHEAKESAKHERSERKKNGKKER
jgi:hypothetical protein